MITIIFLIATLLPFVLGIIFYYYWSDRFHPLFRIRMRIYTILAKRIERKEDKLWSKLARIEDRKFRYLKTD